MLVFELGEEAPLHDRGIVHVPIRRVSTAVIQVGDLVLAIPGHAQRRRPVAGSEPRHDLVADRLDVRALGQDRPGVVDGERLAIALLGAHSAE